jgi:hypothetical protein
VAAAVDCSVSSVSLVVSGKAEGRVRQETQDAIMPRSPGWATG